MSWLWEGCVCVCVCEGGCGISEGVRVGESKRQCTCTHVFLLKSHESAKRT